MSDLISRTALANIIGDWFAVIDYRPDKCDPFNAALLEAGNEVIGAVLEAIDDAPAVDAEPVRHGRWIVKPTGAYRAQQAWCSACGKRSGIGGIKSNQHKPYCPNCGARMDLEGDA